MNWNDRLAIWSFSLFSMMIFLNQIARYWFNKPSFADNEIMLGYLSILLFYLMIIYPISVIYQELKG